MSECTCTPPCLDGKICVSTLKQVVSILRHIFWKRRFTEHMIVDLKPGTWAFGAGGGRTVKSAALFSTDSPARTDARSRPVAGVLHWAETFSRICVSFLRKSVSKWRHIFWKTASDGRLVLCATRRHVRDAGTRAFTQTANRSRRLRGRSKTETSDVRDPASAYPG